MKYANLSWHNSDITDSKVQLVNMGDRLQFWSVDYIYSQMGIPDNQIVKLETKDVMTYDGEEELLLPINFSLFCKKFMREEKISISPKIIPLFIGVYLGYYENRYFNEFNINYLNKYGPIGCRDEETVRLLRKAGVEAYLSGCVTHLLPHYGVTGNNIFFVDVPLELKAYIPRDLRMQAECLSNQFYYPIDGSRAQAEDLIRKQYTRFKEEARLIVTSRLHVASPCMAMGIPVIFAKKEIDSRFSWLDRFIPLYGRNEWDKINWNPKPIEYERHKQKVLQTIMKRIVNRFEEYQNTLDVSTFFENRTKRDYYQNFFHVLNMDFEELFEKIHQLMEKDPQDFEYAIWGLTDGAEALYHCICEKYPKAHLKYVIDTYRNGTFHDVSIKKPDDIKQDKNTYIIILSVGAANMSRNYFKEIHRKADSYFTIPQLFMQKDDLI